MGQHKVKLINNIFEVVVDIEAQQKDHQFWSKQKKMTQTNELVESDSSEEIVAGVSLGSCRRPVSEDTRLPVEEIQ